MDKQGFLFDDNLLIDPEILDSEIEKFCCEVQCSNLAGSSGYFSTTIFQSDFENIDYDFSQLIPSKWDEVKSNIAYLDMVSSLKNKSKSSKASIVQSLKFKNKKMAKKCDKNKKNIKIFYIRKIHTKDCSHRKSSSLNQVKRNKIKKYVEKDFEELRMILVNDQSLPNKKLEIFKKIEDFHSKKSSTNRNFRLFDKDVIIKKIMSNFLKFLKLILQNFSSKLLKSNVDLTLNKNTTFCTEEQTKTFLRKNISEVINFDKTQSRKYSNDINKFLTLKLRDIFSPFFLNSNYFSKYFFVKLKSTYDEEYLNCFISYINKIKITTSKNN